MKPRHASNGGSEEIKANIQETRAQMDHTLDELTERLQPRHILDDVLDYFRSRPSSGHSSGQRRQKVRRAAGQAASQVKEKAATAGRGAMRQAKEHPLPALLIGAGISMLLMERYRSDGYDSEMDEDGVYDPAYGAAEAVSASAETAPAQVPGPETYALPHHLSEQSSSEVMGKIKESGAQLKERTGSRLQEMKGQAGERLQDMKHRTGERAQQLRRRASEKGAKIKQQAQDTCERSIAAFKRTSDKRPFAVGLGFLALGVLAGMLLPSTRKEDELMGPTRDRVVDRTREVAEDAVSRGKHVAQTAAETVTSEARAQGLTPEMLKEKAQAIASKVKETTREEAKHQQEEFKNELKPA